MLDDDEMLSVVLETMFRRLGVPSVSSLNDSIEAIEMLKIKPTSHDLIMLDLMMPGLDGIEFLSELADIGFPGHVILMSGVDRPILASLQRLGNRRLSIIGVLEKPIRISALRALLSGIDETPTTSRRMLPRTSTRAITDGMLKCEFMPYFQPKINLRSGRVTGFEALARWRRTNGRIMSPASFVSLAEKKGLIHELDLSILEQTLAYQRKWQDAGFRLTAAVNCSAPTLGRAKFADAVLGALRRHRVEPSDLLLELTESILIEDASSAMENILRLHLYGVRLSMDDFGTGYSSLRYLSQIPFSELKVDQCFVTAATGDPAKLAIIEHSVNLARKLALVVVCEGVESAEDATLVGALGADLGQGYYYSKPLPPEDFLNWTHAFNTLGEL